MSSKEYVETHSYNNGIGSVMLCICGHVKSDHGYANKKDNFCEWISCECPGYIPVQFWDESQGIEDLQKSLNPVS